MTQPPARLPVRRIAIPEEVLERVSDLLAQAVVADARERVARRRGAAAVSRHDPTPADHLEFLR